MSRVLFLEGRPEGLVMVKHAFSASPEARNRNKGAFLQGAFLGERIGGLQAKKRPYAQIDHSETAAFAV
jgi:hypothetical protein